jgi:acyl-CoA synthetase (AMP-forming)/AMP-acid ligase II
VLVKPVQVLSQFPAQGQRRVSDAPQPQDVALFLHTSGTTGRPKVCVIPVYVYIRAHECVHLCGIMRSLNLFDPSTVITQIGLIRAQANLVERFEARRTIRYTKGPTMK